jgi:hypothetical protein
LIGRLGSGGSAPSGVCAGNDAGATPGRRRGDAGTTPRRRRADVGATPGRRRDDAGTTPGRRRDDAGTTPRRRRDDNPICFPKIIQLAVQKPIQFPFQIPKKTFKTPFQFSIQKLSNFFLCYNHTKKKSDENRMQNWTLLFRTQNRKIIERKSDAKSDPEI